MRGISPCCRFFVCLSSCLSGFGLNRADIYTLPVTGLTVGIMSISSLPYLFSRIRRSCSFCSCLTACCAFTSSDSSAVRFRLNLLSIIVSVGRLMFRVAFQRCSPLPCPFVRDFDMYSAIRSQPRSSSPDWIREQLQYPRFSLPRPAFQHFSISSRGTPPFMTIW